MHEWRGGRTPRSRQNRTLICFYLCNPRVAARPGHLPPPPPTRCLILAAQRASSGLAAVKFTWKRGGGGAGRGRGRLRVEWRREVVTSQSCCRPRPTNTLSWSCSGCCGPVNTTQCSHTHRVLFILPRQPNSSTALYWRTLAWWSPEIGFIQFLVLVCGESQLRWLSQRHQVKFIADRNAIQP